MWHPTADEGAGSGGQLRTLGIGTIERWKESIRLYLESSGSDVPLTTLGQVVPRPAGAPRKPTLSELLARDSRFRIHGEQPNFSVSLFSGMSTEPSQAALRLPVEFAELRIVKKEGSPAGLESEPTGCKSVRKQHERIPGDISGRDSTKGPSIRTEGSCQVRALVPSISSNLAAQKISLLYVDVLNYSNDFFPISDWNVTRALARVKKFVAAAAKSGYSLKAFLDDTITSAEARSKWQRRRENEVLKGVKRVPHGMNVMLGEMFVQCGVDVLYSAEADNDDTIASYAQAQGAGVLSQDKDMFRYVGATFPVYSNYTISSKGDFSLTPHPQSAFRHPHPRPILTPPPRTRCRIQPVKDGAYIRGAPSPCVRALASNPHAVVTPLRHAAYSCMGLVGHVREEWPEWDPTVARVVWHIGVVAVCPAEESMLALLRNPDAAAAALFPRECGSKAGGGAPKGVEQREWARHAMSVRSCVYEVCAMAGGPTLAELWLRWEAAAGSR